MNILGINAYHGDSSACLVIDGKLVCAIEEERIRRIKHWAGLPLESIRWCLDYGGIKYEDIDFIAISRNPWSRFHQKAKRALFCRPKLSIMENKLGSYFKLCNIKAELAAGLQADPKSIRAKVVFVEHHKAHLASSFFVSPFKEAALVSIDGFGDNVSAMTGLGAGNKIRVLQTVCFPHSLGIFYSAVTQFLGFRDYGDEYKVMGLSAFGRPVYMDKLREVVRLKDDGLFELDTSYFLHGSHGVELTWLNETPRIGRLYSAKLVELFGGEVDPDREPDERSKDIASSLQRMYEEAFFHMLRQLNKRTGLENAALSGGCLQNSLANGKIREMTPFKDVYIPPSAHDAGGAVGAAFYLWNQVLGKDRQFVMDSAYWGPDFSEKDMISALNGSGLDYQMIDEATLMEMAARDIASGKIVGWFQGRTEWGPRALGDRSILADPRSRKIPDILNARIKKREPFRPFAVSILEEKAGEWFEGSFPAPFMENVYGIKKDRSGLIPAVCHVDGTARVQTISMRGNEKYYKLITQYEKITGIPAVLNTSFNENEPIVNTPGDTVDCFKRSGMDVLVMGGLYIKRPPRPS